MKVLHIQKVSGLGGSERHLLTLMPSLVNRGITTRICVLGAPGHASFREELEKVGVDHRVIRAGPDLNPTLFWALNSEIGDFGPDIVHTHLIHADLYGQLAARRRGVPGVSSVHSAHSFYLKPAIKWAARTASHLAKMTLAISEHVKGFLESDGIAPPDRIRVVHYGIDTEAWSLPESQARQIRADFGTDITDVTVGIASRLIPHKGHKFLIDAFSDIYLTAPQVHLLVAGQGVLGRELQDYCRAKNLTRVHFLGELQDMRAFMNACDMLVFPTSPEFGEGFGLAALEAMAAGIPVIATEVGPLKEIVVDGETGYLIPPTSRGQLAERILTLASQPSLRARLGIQAKERVKSHFSLEKMVEGTLNVYDEILHVNSDASTLSRETD